MNMLKVLAAVAATAGLFVLSDLPAKASTLKLVGGTAGTIPDAGETNDVLVGLGFGNSIAGFFGSTISLIGSSPVLAEFLGYEAGYKNRFSFAGGSFYTETDDPTPGNNREIFATPPSYTTSSLSGLLAFLFSTTGGTPGSVSNGANPDDPGDGPTGVNFFASVVGAPTCAQRPVGDPVLRRQRREQRRRPRRHGRPAERRGRAGPRHVAAAVRRPCRARLRRAAGGSRAA